MNIPYGRQEITQEDIDSVVKVLQSDFLTQGPLVPKFEQAVAKYCGVSEAVAVNSATSALHIACLALGVGRGDLVWTTAITFVASANCALYCGASVDFIDIDPDSFNVSVKKLSEKLLIASKTGKLPKVVIVVHLCGQPCDMLGIKALSEQYDFKVIEDASHAIGAKYKNEPVGRCRYSDVTIFSFHPVKIITTGEGGMAVTADPQIAKHMRMLRSHGITNSPEDMEARLPHEIWNYQQVTLGYNYRMTDVQAALGLSQMARLDAYVLKRQGLAKKYENLLSALPVLSQAQPADCYSSYHLYVIRLQLKQIKKTQRQVYEQLHAAGILVNLHYIPLYRHPYYERMGFSFGSCPNAERYFSEALSIPIFPGLSESQQEFIGHTLQRVLVE